MIGPYRMVLVNIISSLLLFGGTFFYKYIYPKKKINLFVLLLLISILPLISILRAGVYQSGDFTINVYKTMSLYSAFSDKVFLPSWAEALNATYGYPLFMFTYPLPYYIASLFHFIGFSFINSIKLLLIGSFILSGITMYLWAKDSFGKLPGFVASIFYLFNPYHLIDLNFRADIGEIISFVFLPLTLLSARKIFKEPKPHWFLLASLSICGLILSHQAVSVSFIPFVILYGLFEFYRLRKKEMLKLFSFGFSVLLGFLLSAFYWIPGIFEGIYTRRAITQEILFRNFWEYLFSPWKMGLLFQGDKGELSFIIGYIQLFVILTALVFLFKHMIKNTYQKQFLMFFLFAFFFTFFMTQSISKPLWYMIPLIKNFQFTFRLLVDIAFFTSAIAAVIAKNIKKPIFIYALLSIAIFSTILNWGNRGTIADATDSVLARNVPLSTSLGEGLEPAAPKWLDIKHIWLTVIPKNHLEVLSGRAKIYQTFRNSVRHEYTVVSQKPSLFKENTAYFPGWTVYANDKKINIYYQNPKYPGIITFTLPNGYYKIKVVFEDTIWTLWGKLISIFTLIGICLLLLAKFLMPKALSKH